MIYRKKLYRIFYPFLIINMILFFSTCKKTSVEPPTEYVEVPEDLIPYFYGNPAWHPAGKWIAVEPALPQPASL